MDFAVLLPPGWARIPLDGRENARAMALAKAKAGEVPEPGRHAALQKLQSMIRRALVQARQAGGTDILISLAELNGIPLAASCLVRCIPYEKPVSLGTVASELKKEHGEVTDMRIGGAHAVRHRFTEPSMVRVDYHLRIPGRTELMTFSYSTPEGPLADSLTMLFDAITETLRWQP